MRVIISGMELLDQLKYEIRVFRLGYSALPVDNVIPEVLLQALLSTCVLDGLRAGMTRQAADDLNAQIERAYEIFFNEIYVDGMDFDDFYVQVLDSIVCATYEVVSQRITNAIPWNVSVKWFGASNIMISAPPRGRRFRNHSG